MEFWSKGLGKKTIAMSLTKGESSLSEDALCLKGVMEEPITWEYVMLLDEADLKDFFALLQEPQPARFIYDSPNRWYIYAGFVKGGAQIAGRAILTMLRHSFGSAAVEAREKIQLPPPSMIKARKKRGKERNPPYKRRLSTTTLEAPTMGRNRPAEALSAGGA